MQPPRERLVVTGRAGWMGMGRGAGRSALGFWPTLAFLLCSFPAGKSDEAQRSPGLCTRSHGRRAQHTQWALSPSHISAERATMLGDSCDGVSRCQRPKGGLSAPRVRLPRNTDHAAAVSPCKILKCNSEFWSATAGSHSPASDDAPEFCAALRTYALCTRRTARTCRGDLAYHSAVHGIEDLMSQYNCSKDGPTSQPRLRTLPPPGDSQERSDSPEICHYEKSFHKHSAAPNYTHCGLFGDPHLRTFTDRFQTCKVQGAWPLIDNNYLNVQVTNTPVLPGSAATATSKDLLARPSLCPSHCHIAQGAQAQNSATARTSGAPSACSSPSSSRTSRSAWTRRCTRRRWTSSPPPSPTVPRTVGTSTGPTA
ncbi:repulsive guidance molecule A isoform X3 [Mirounga angustirostris]|uniref:repulsive guidance molecule A isoform X3 n=1 Tax=Mirounga angustirostris TaxID=9716 RepID=UPI00313CD53F